MVVVGQVRDQAGQQVDLARVGHGADPELAEAGLVGALRLDRHTEHRDAFTPKPRHDRRVETAQLGRDHGDRGLA